MHTSLCEFTSFFRWRNRYETFLSTMTLHLITDNLTDVLNLFNSESSLIFVVYVNEKVVRLRLLLNDIQLLTLLDSLNVLLVEFIQFIEWHAEDTAVHEHMR